jgi:hypothetical protein
MILILAANTSFADFPRLANFHAQDAFMPRPLTKRGHRLVFSNGVVGLAIAATALAIVFRADVHRLIPLYAIGVFTSFTLSQAGMARRHLRLKEPGWRHGLAINGVGAVTTAAVTIIVAVTKFSHGAWAVMVFVPLMVALLVRMNRHYDRESRELAGGLSAFERDDRRPPAAVVVVEDLDRPTRHAIGYAKTIHARPIHAVHVDADGTAGLRRRWDDEHVGIPFVVLPRNGGPGAAIAAYVGDLDGETAVNVLVPGPHRMGTLERIRRGRTGARLARALSPYDNVRLTLVRDHAVPHEPVAGSAVLPRRWHVAIVLIDRIDNATVRAVRHALSVGADEIVALHAADDPQHQRTLIADWMELRMPIPLELVECWDRDVARAVESFVVERTTPTTEVTVVMARRDYHTLRQRLLHDRTSRRIGRALDGYAHVDLTVVPFYVSKSDGPSPGGSAPRTPSAVQ